MKTWKNLNSQLKTRTLPKVNWKKNPEDQLQNLQKFQRPTKTLETPKYWLKKPSGQLKAFKKSQKQAEKPEKVSEANKSK